MYLFLLNIQAAHVYCFYKVSILTPEVALYSDNEFSRPAFVIVYFNAWFTAGQVFSCAPVMGARVPPILWG